MPYVRQKMIQKELDARIPRGLRGSRQNELRFGFYFYRSQGHSFDTSLELALAQVRIRETDFAPRILPVRSDTPQV